MFHGKGVWLHWWCALAGEGVIISREELGAKGTEEMYPWKKLYMSSQIADRLGQWSSQGLTAVLRPGFQRPRRRDVVLWSKSPVLGLFVRLSPDIIGNFRLSPRRFILQDQLAVDSSLAFIRSRLW